MTPSLCVMTDRRAARWSNLFDDLAAQLENELGAEELDLHAEEERLRLGRLTLRDRLVAISASDSPASVVLADSRSIRIHISTVGRDWFAGDVLDGSSRHSQCVIPLAALSALELETAIVETSLDPPATDANGLTVRLGLSYVLRDLCRRRSGVQVQLRSGDAHGTIDRVGRDHFDLAIHASDSPRRREAVSGIRIVPFAELVMVRV
ncbi:MAG: hypothetical protein JWN80_210 [Microbacteriaceae bacterium]|nr:hypothetical protein [Microbacteriaceae bacterium]